MDGGAGLEGRRECDGDGLLEEVGVTGCPPRGHPHRVDDPLAVPTAESSEFILKRDGRSEVFLEVLHDLFGVEVWGEVARRVVPGMGVGHVAGEHDFSPADFMALRPMGFPSRQTWVWKPT